MGILEAHEEMIKRKVLSTLPERMEVKAKTFDTYENLAYGFMGMLIIVFARHWAGALYVIPVVTKHLIAYMKDRPEQVVFSQSPATEAGKIEVHDMDEAPVDEDEGME